MNTNAQAIDPTGRTDGIQDPALGDARVNVREVDLSSSARALTTLSRVDYTDSFVLETEHAQARTGEQWARAVLEDAPAATRTTLRRGWFALGVRLGSTEDDRLVLGWAVRRSSPDFALLAARSLFGMEAEVMLKREPHGVLGATFMKLNNPIVRVFWAGFSSKHRTVLRHLLIQAGRRAHTELGLGQTGGPRSAMPSEVEAPF